MKNQIQKSKGYKACVKESGKRFLSLVMVMTMSTWCLAGCGSASENNDKTVKKDSSSDTANMEALLTSKVGDVSGTDKKETVYVEMKADGTVTKTTVSDVLKVSGNDNIKDYSTLDEITNLSGNEKFAKDKDNNIVWENKGKDISYQGTTTEAPPISIQVTYYLDDKEIKPDELAGKSGKVKMVYDYTNNAEGKNDEFVPFLILTGMVLDEDNFSNINIDNGKVIEHDGSDIVIGYAAPGLKNHLLTTIKNSEQYIGDIEIPESVTVTADVKDFSMDMTLTVATSQVGDLDLDKTLDFSDVEKQMNELQDGTDKLVDGAKELASGATKLESGSSKINSGAKDLSKYTIQMSQGTGSLNNKYTIFNKALLSGVKSANSGATQIYKGTKEVESAATAVNGGAKELESAATAINSGSKELESVAAAVDPGAEELESAVGAINDGSKKLAEGSAEAKAGFEDETNSDGTTKSQGLNNGSASLANGAESANKGVQELAQTLQQTPDSIQQQIDEIIKKISTATGGKIASEAALNATVEGINTAVKDGMELTAVLTAKGLDAKTYYSLLQAYYSVSTLETVKSDFDKQIQSKAKDIKELLSGMDSLETGAKSLNVGIEKLYSGIKEINVGTQKLAGVTGAVNTGMKTLKKGTSGMKTGTAKLQSATSELKKGTKDLSKGTSALKAGSSKLKTAMKQLSEGASALNSKIGDASPQIKSGISQINDAAVAISKGAGTLASGTESLGNGVVTLAAGTKELKSGVIKLNKEGISKITDIFGEDAKDAVSTIEDTLNAGKDYRSFSGISGDTSGDVKFIFRTEEIKADK